MAENMATEADGSVLMRNVPLFTVDSFTDRPFAGNPAAVCLDNTERGLSDELMQKIAAEMNISETAFLQPIAPSDTFKSGGRFKLRWFTPVMEVPLCGHATLASAAVLFNCLGNTATRLRFDTASGPLFARKLRGSAISIDLPLNTTQPQDRRELTDLLKAAVGEQPLRDVRLSPSTGKLLLRLTDDTHRKDLETMKPQIDRFIHSSKNEKIKGVIITLKGDKNTGGIDEKGEEYDFLSRYFAPWVGIPEDPVTGSAHTVLAEYWSQQLNKKELYARQCSARGGDLRLQVAENGRVDICGQAAVVLRGTMVVPPPTDTKVGH